MKTKKAQAALEFLMTYGWALIAVLAAIGAFTYLGILNTDKLIPEQCTITPGFECEDYVLRGTTGGVITGSEIEIAIKNSLGVTVTLDRTFIATEVGNSDDNAFCGMYTSSANQLGGSVNPTVTLRNGETGYVSCNPGLFEELIFEPGELYTVDFEFEYNVSGKKYPQKSSWKNSSKSCSKKLIF